MQVSFRNIDELCQDNNMHTYVGIPFLNPIPYPLFPHRARVNINNISLLS